MDRRVKGIVLLLLIVGGGGFYFLVINPFGTTFHFQSGYPSGFSWVWIDFDNLEDTNLTIGYVDDATLMYSMDVVLYEQNSASSLGLTTYVYASFYKLYLDPSVRVKSLNLTLGNGMYYRLDIDGGNLNSDITYSNNAIIGVSGEDVNYNANGVLRFTIKSDINCSQGFHVALGAIRKIQGTVYLTVRDTVVPSRHAYFYVDSLSFTHLEWYLRNEYSDEYSDVWPIVYPQMLIQVRATACVASLHA